LRLKKVLFSEEEKKNTGKNCITGICAGDAKRYMIDESQVIKIGVYSKKTCSVV